MKPLVAGAGLYTAGAGLEFAGWPTLLPGIVGPHEVFHLAVLAGMACHWQFVSQFATGEAPPPVGAEPALRRKKTEYIAGNSVASHETIIGSRV